MFIEQYATSTTPVGTDTAKALNSGLVVSLDKGNFLEIDTPTITSSVSYFSPVQEFPAPRTRMGVIAYYFQETPPPSGSYIILEWAKSPTGPWYPAPVSTTGDARIAKVTASGDSNSEDSVMLVRVQPMNTCWRVEIRSGGVALTGGKLSLTGGQ